MKPPEEGNFTPKPFTEHTLDPQSLLTFENPRMKEYDELLARLAKERKTGSIDQEPYSDQWKLLIFGEELGRDVPALRYLREKLKGKWLLDLGSGSGGMKDVARILGVSRYIGVDKYPGRKESGSGYKDIVLKESANGSTIEVAVASGDMLQFIARLPSESVNITINGIDVSIINDESYYKALATEIARVTPSGGIVFGVNAEVFRYLDQSVFEPLIGSIFINDSDHTETGANIFIKK